MKYILLLLLSFNLYAQSESAPAEPLPMQVTCGLESHEEIDACTLEDKLPRLIGRLYPDSRYKKLSDFNAEDPCDPETIDNEETEEIEVCPPWNPKEDAHSYLTQTFDENDAPELSFYERLQMEPKPSITVFETDLADWKQEQKDKLDFRNSINNMSRFRRRMVKCGYNQPNMALLKKKLIEDRDTTKRDCLLSHTADLNSEDQAREEKKNKRKNHKDTLKSLTCNALQGVLKAMCDIMKSEL